LVNNAGWVKINEIETSTLEEFRRHERIILEGTYLGCKYALPALKSAGRGSIINISALAGERGNGCIPAYSAVKAGIHGLSRAIAMDFKNRKYNIRVNCVAPGAHDTPMTQLGIRERGTTDPGVANTVMAGLGQPEDIANAVLFFASDES